MKRIVRHSNYLNLLLVFNTNVGSIGVGSSGGGWVLGKLFSCFVCSNMMIVDASQNHCLFVGNYCNNI